ncbi:MAG: hypothetical protein HQ581_08810 [Planctomycetes bacterium]|nr:hypothetical protein [Planctomycetota bacterium]
MKKKSTQKRTAGKPSKPHPDFPLFVHGGRTTAWRWAKKVRGKLVYFGKVADDPDGAAALERWIADRDYLLAGKTPPGDKTALTIGDMVNLYLEARDADVTAGELSSDAFECYTRTARRLIATFGRRRQVVDLGPDDFRGLRAALAKEYAPTTLMAEIARTRAFFNWAVRDELVERVRFGEGLKAPSARTLLTARNADPPKMLEVAELRQVIDQAPAPYKAYILLGVNAAYGAHDVATLPRKAIDLDGAWVTHARPKTGVARRCPLWPETVQAIREALAVQVAPEAPKYEHLAFLNKDGRPYDNGRTSRIGVWFGTHLRRLGLYQPRLGFYVLRRVFRTVADATLDQAACDVIMGHTRHDMASVYRQGVDDSRLQAVTDHVHAWLFDDADDGQGEEPDVVPFSRIG